MDTDDDDQLQKPFWRGLGEWLRDDWFARGLLQLFVLMVLFHALAALVMMFAAN